MKKTFTIKNLTLTAMFMALNIVMSSFGVPVPGGHFYLNDVIICAASILLDPFSAFIVGGLGAFIGDLIFYPTPMFVSLVTHGLQAVVISLFVQKVSRVVRKPAQSLVSFSVRSLWLSDTASDVHSSTVHRSMQS